MAVNEVLLNGEQLISTRNSSVTEQTLVENETALNRAGEGITGQLNPVSEDEAYMWTDEPAESKDDIAGDDLIPFYDESEDEKKNITLNQFTEKLDETFAKDTEAYQTTDSASTDIADSDYIPFNDVSDTNAPKKKTLFSNIIDKLKNTFLVKTNSHIELSYSNDCIHTKDLQIDASKSDNDISATHYPTTNSILDKNGKIIGRMETVASTDGKIGIKMYANNFDTSGNAVGSNSIEAYIDKSGNKSYSVSDPNKFREAIKTVDQVGVNIPSSADLNTYLTAGTYRITDDATAQTLSNCPITVCGKLIVSDNGNGGYTQIILANHSPKMYTRSYWSSAWSDWTDLTSSSDLNRYANLNTTNKITSGDLNDYKTAGTFEYGAGSSSNIAHVPASGYAGYLFVMQMSASRVKQIVIDRDRNYIYQRTFNYDANTWSDWVKIATMNDISPSTVGNGYAVATVSGSTITATITGFQLRAGVIVAIRLPSTITADCTLNINNTGAKTVTLFNQARVTIGNPLMYGGHVFMYDGTYYQKIAQDFTPNVTISGYSAETSGVFRMDWGYGSNKAQINHSVSDGRLTYNFYKNGAWRGDSFIAEQRHLITNKGSAIPSNANLNDYKSEGVYNIELTATAQTISNIPVSSAGKLVVMAKRNSANTEQIYYPYSDTTIYRRTQDNSSWGGWVKSVDSDESISQKVGGLLHRHISVPDNSGRMKYLKFCDITTWYNSTTTGQSTQSFVGVAFASRTGGHMNVDKIVTLNMGVSYQKVTDIDGAYLRLFTSDWTYLPCILKETLNSVTKYYLALRVSNSGHDLELVGRWAMNTNSYANNFINEWINTTDSSGTLPTGYSVEKAGTIIREDVVFGTCSTAGDQSTKVVTLEYKAFILKKGAIVAVRFTNTNTASNVTLNVNGTGAKSIYYGTSAYTSTSNWICGQANRTIFYMYDGTYWVWMSMGQEVDTTNLMYSRGTVTCETGTTRPETRALTWQWAYNNGYPNTYGNILTLSGTGDSQLLIPWSGTSGQAEPMWFRSKRDSASANWSSWDRVYSTFYPQCLYGTCATAETTTAKEVTLNSGYFCKLSYGSIVTVKFTYKVPASATLNVASSGAKNIYYRGSVIQAGVILAGDLATFIYDGTQYNLIGIDRVNNEQNGMAWAVDSRTSASSTVTATSDYYKAVKGGYVTVKFNYDVPANALLNINGQGAFGIFRRGARITAGQIKANDRATFLFVNDDYVLVANDGWGGR